MPENAQLTPWPKELPEWDSLSLEEKKLFIKQADVYGAYLAYTDHEIGRVIQAVEDLGELDNTLIIYIGGDNGASAGRHAQRHAERVHHLQWRSRAGQGPVPLVPFWGSERTFPHFAAGWAWAMDTPFKWVKQVASHFGGTAQGVAMSWPGHINDVGGIRRQFHHVIDIVPTILEATGIPAPDTIDGIKQRPIEGVSMAYTWDKANANAPTRHTTQYFEMLGNRAIYHDGWVAATTPATLPWELSTATPPDVITGYNWELYNVQEDPTQSNDLAAKMPDKLKEMQDLFYSEAKKYDVLPLDNSTLARWNTPRPSLTAGRTEFTYSGELTGVPTSAAPSILNKSYTITAEVEIPEGGAEGMIVTEGGRFGGYGLFLSKGEFGVGRGKVVFLYNLLDLKRTMWEGPELEAGKHTIVFDFKSDGPGLGKGGTGVLSVDGQEVARNSMEHTTPITFPEDETFDIGQDTRTGGRAGGVSLRCSVQVHRQDRQADLQTRTGAAREASPSSLAMPTVASAKDQANRRDEEGAHFRRCRRSRDRIGVADCSVARRAVVVRRGACRRRHTGGARGRHRPDRVRDRLLAGPAAGRHVDLQRGRRAVSRLPRFRRRVDRHSTVAGGRPARDPDSPPGVCLGSLAAEGLEPEVKGNGLK